MTTPTEFAGAAQAVAAALQAAAVDPADGVRLLATLADFSPAVATPASEIGAAMATMQTAEGALFRRAALVAMCRASADYQPASYDDAVTLRVRLAALLDAEIQRAGDDGSDATFAALRALRAAVVQDLTARGASLARMQQVEVAASLPAPVLAQRLYRDATRADDLVLQANPPHPAFMPRTFTALNS
ncbi:hypothetical protein [uncultured Pseudacidovorax sp.]|uniref:hypothetical protein n=1 Tax=uncultured Pseudacidovorax sp. TaxID=679313 RepID=UPI0025D5D806|nr:hypothetical protein [uncultured Pseudacidovorax sp.]